MSVFRPLLARLVHPLTYRPTPAYLSQFSPLWYKRPLDVDDDQLETVQLKQPPARSQQSFSPSNQFAGEGQGQPGWGVEQGPGGGGGAGFGQGGAHRDAPPTQTREGPSERSINQVVLMGRAGTDPQIRGTEDKPITTFSLATNSTWKTQNPGPGDSEWSSRVDWHNVVVFKPGLRENAYNYVHKGCRVHITGRIIYGEVMDRSGVKRHTTTIACEDIIYLTRKT
eukprot:GFUD01028478.1.p1 GENE.GFUD01028478.1~~GFUD01028478.1.p1  ORF type:complete len:225 (-),score=74.51 GFUD01028478.1:93-767(-)